ncbi:tyrosine-type recombinase/integrase [Polynucleobacter sphagniphilus]|jgi:integrase|uniref:Integrase n=1 Tax=Polynucleobacter sphagniphilus TaxID=1743169 RepID=A0AA43S536_9BURK|nr:integrase arm-type DNA-binding domain-containing protein [Polynucleobacter sphagniphilus]MDH6502932.1 integrase [Polynucleobacter sphagniphilus]MDH6511593.1 integrase [Polynucleobacter sphagniphilus]
MASKLLTDSFIKAIKPLPTFKGYSDGDGLSLLVLPNGVMSWRYRYRYAGKAKMLSLKSYPEVTLKQARENRDELKKILQSGKDPSLFRQQASKEKIKAQANTFEAIAGEWHERWKADKTPEHAERVWRRLELNIFPHVQNIPISEITPKALKGIIQKLEDRDATSMTRRVLNTCSQVFGFAVHEELMDINPAKNIDAKLAFKPHVEKNFKRVSARELPALLRAIDGYGDEVAGTELTRLGLQLLAYTFVRTSELIGARWDEIDLKKGVWQIPAERMKMRNPHIVKLSKQSLAIFKRLHEITGGRDLVFPNAKSPKKTMSNNTLIYALYRLGYHSKMTGHGFRGIASTILHEQGFPHAHIELQLAHSEKDKVSSAYNYAEYLEPRAKMLQAWADYLDGIKAGAEVINIKQA